MTNKERKEALEARAEATADRLRRFAQKVEDLSWALDAAISAVDKDASGYRCQSAANPDGGRNALAGELEAALFKAEAFLLSLGRAEGLVGGEPEAVVVGGTYGRHYEATLAGFDAALAHVRALQLAGYVGPARVIYAS